MDSENMQFLLSRVTEFDDMKSKRFGLKKCKTLSPRILALQKSLGFTPGEPINAKNIHRIIPATQNIDMILNKSRRSMTPMQKIQPGKVLTPQNRFLPGSSRMSGVTPSAPNRTNGVNCRFSTPTSTKSYIKKVSAHHDIVGAILKQSSSTSLSSCFSSPNAAKSSTAKVTAPRNLHGRILERDSTQTTNGTSRPTANRTSIGITYHLPAPNIKDSSLVKDKEHFSKTSDGDMTSSQESGISVSTIDTVTSEEKENEMWPSLMQRTSRSVPDTLKLEQEIFKPEPKVSISQNRFRPGSSNISGVTSRVHTPNTTNGVNHRFSTQSSTKSSVQKISAGHDVVGAILKRASFTALPSRFSTPNTAKSSIKKDKVRSSKNPDVEPNLQSRVGNLCFN